MLKATENKNPHQWIMDEYPPVITKKQFCILCRISNPKAHYLLENGLIPYRCTGLIKNRYHIRTADVVQFLSMRDQSPKEYQPPAGWSMERRREPVPDTSLVVNQKMQWAARLLMTRYPDVLTVEQVAEITGRTAATVAKWCRSGRLRSIKTLGEIGIPKVSMLAFFTMDEYRCITAKLKQEMLRRLKR